MPLNHNTLVCTRSMLGGTSCSLTSCSYSSEAAIMEDRWTLNVVFDCFLTLCLLCA